MERFDVGIINALAFDIETKPLTEAALKKLCPEFNPLDVKVGNMKDPKKIAAKLEESEQNHFRDFCAKAGLSTLKSKLLMIGIYLPAKGQLELIEHRDERVMLTEFWNLFRACVDHGTQMIGCNICEFDLPYLVQRSWATSTPVPRDLYHMRGRNISWSHTFVDIRFAFQLGRREAPSSFNLIAQTMGMPGKTEEIGATFHEFLASDRERALKYLAQDCARPYQIAERMGLIL